MRCRLWSPAIVFLVAFTTSCAPKTEESAAPAAAEATPAPAAAPAAEEKTYVLTGKIASRDAAAGKLTVEHDKIEGLWEPMTMGFEVRGSDVASLPPDGSRIRATLHVVDGTYWLTDVRPE